ncbi:uncharacterized protein CEXT_752911 [Caerostris extrusa]|uniref:DNA-directed RNA polymerase III subunit RPC4 n=1 Tax=Caerostris extrusa TaxID=172846 RepID=A0AAV4TCR5_CAEEX|nr:uncharacterized protein CEXT_752911 [Caerostris extrusa]
MDSFFTKDDMPQNSYTLSLRDITGNKRERISKETRLLRYTLQEYRWGKELAKQVKTSMSQPEDKKPDFSNLPRGAIGLRGLPVSRNARLPSIRSPRDLTLGTQPKRIFTPNIPARREKKSSEPIKNEVYTPRVNANPTTARSNRGGKSRGNIIQLEGSIFGDGPSQSTSKVAKPREYASRSESSGRLSTRIKKEKLDLNVHIVDREMKNLMRDDFIDDGSSNSSDESLKPVVYPISEAKNETVKSEKCENFQNIDFAKDMGFDVKKIEQFIKKEKTEVPTRLEPDLPGVPKSKTTEFLTKVYDSQIFLIELPKCLVVPAPDYLPKEQTVNGCSNEEKKSDTSLKSLQEGPIGKLQILKSGHVRIKIGSLYYYCEDIESLHTKHELVSLKMNSDQREMITVAKCEKKLNLVPSTNIC